MTSSPDFWPSALGVHALDGGRYTVEKKALDALVSQCYAAEAERDEALAELEDETTSRINLANRLIRAENQLRQLLVPVAGVNHDVWVKGTHGKATT